MLQNAMNTLTTVTRLLDDREYRLKNKDAEVFGKIVSALKANDSSRAKMLASELSELRKTEKTVMKSKLAFNAIVLRMETVKDLGDFNYILGPAIAVAATLQKQLAKVMPEASGTISDSFSSLQQTMSEAGQLTGSSFNVSLANEEAESIIREAAAAAEEQARQKFPEVPSRVRQLESGT
jgi:division protein CdvB (Snf7/Vps24/ESCRT-III family)